MPTLDIRQGCCGKEVGWGETERGIERPSVAEILEAAKLVFPGVDLGLLEIGAAGYDAEVIILRTRHHH